MLSTKSLMSANVSIAFYSQAKVDRGNRRRVWLPRKKRMTVALDLLGLVAVNLSWKHGKGEAVAWRILTCSHGQGPLRGGSR